MYYFDLIFNDVFKFILLKMYVINVINSVSNFWIVCVLVVYIMICQNKKYDVNIKLKWVREFVNNFVDNIDMIKVELNLDIFQNIDFINISIDIIQCIIDV